MFESEIMYVKIHVFFTQIKIR